MNKNYTKIYIIYQHNIRAWNLKYHHTYRRMYIDPFTACWISLLTKFTGIAMDTGNLLLCVSFYYVVSSDMSQPPLLGASHTWAHSNIARQSAYKPSASHRKKRPAAPQTDRDWRPGPSHRHGSGPPRAGPPLCSPAHEWVDQSSAAVFLLLFQWFHAATKSASSLGSS